MKHIIAGAAALLLIVTALGVTTTQAEATGGFKVPVCHKGQTKSVPIPAVLGHLQHGDTLGPCAPVPPPPPPAPPVNNAPPYGCDSPGAICPDDEPDVQEPSEEPELVDDECLTVIQADPGVTIVRMECGDTADYPGHAFFATVGGELVAYMGPVEEPVLLIAVR